MEKYLTIHENKNQLEQLYSAKEFKYKEEDYWIKRINNLQRYSERGDEVLEHESGEYIKLEDVLNLFVTNYKNTNMDKNENKSRDGKI